MVGGCPSHLKLLRRADVEKHAPSASMSIDTAKRNKKKYQNTQQKLVEEMHVLSVQSPEQLRNIYN